MQDATTTDYDYVTYLGITAHKSLWELIGRTLQRRDDTAQLHVSSLPVTFGGRTAKLSQLELNPGQLGTRH